jgi:hypothetical protein
VRIFVALALAWLSSLVPAVLALMVTARLPSVGDSVYMPCAAVIAVFCGLPGAVIGVAVGNYCRPSLLFAKGFLVAQAPLAVLWVGTLVSHYRFAGYEREAIGAAALLLGVPGGVAAHCRGRRRPAPGKE